MYNDKVNNFFKKNENVIKTLFESFCVPHIKQVITFGECQKLIEESELNINAAQI